MDLGKKNHSTSTHLLGQVICLIDLDEMFDALN
jgi:hypothetical protein